MHSLTQLEKILKAVKDSPVKEFTLEVRTYNEAPQFMSVRLDEDVFAEPYHKGNTAKQDHSVLTSCLGKMIPVARTTVDSNLGQVLDAQFEMMWKRSEHRSLRPGCSGLLEVELRGHEWVRRFQDRQRQAEQSLEIGSGLFSFPKPPKPAGTEKTDEEQSLTRRQG